MRVGLTSLSPKLFYIIIGISQFNICLLHDLKNVTCFDVCYFCLKVKRACTLYKYMIHIMVRLNKIAST